MAATSSRNSGSSASHHAAGSCSLRGGVVGGCGLRPLDTNSPVSASRTSTLVACVDESTPSTSGMRRRVLPHAQQKLGHELVEALVGLALSGQRLEVEPLAAQGR